MGQSWCGKHKNKEDISKRSEQLFCDCEIPKPTDPYDVVDKHICRDCKQIIAK